MVVEPRGQASHSVKEKSFQTMEKNRIRGRQNSLKGGEQGGRVIFKNR